MSKVQSNSERIATNTIMLYIRSFITLVISLYASRLILTVLGVTDYGIYNVVGGFVGMFSLISASLTISTQRFITFELGKKNDGHPTEVFSTAILIHVFLSLVILILAESFGVWFLNNKMSIPEDRLSASNWVFQLSLATFLLNFVTIPHNSAIVAHEKMSAFAIFSIIEAVLKLLILFVLQGMTVDKLVGYAVLMLCVILLMRVVYIFYCKIRFVECHFILVKEKHYYKEMLGFSGWNIIGSSAGVLTNYGINVLMNLFFGVVVNAARGVATQVESAVNQFVGNFTMAINPQITKSYASGDYSYMMMLVMRGARYSYFLLLLMAIPIFIEADFILNLWLVEVPDYAVAFVRLTLIYSLCQSLSNTLYTAMLATGKIKKYQIIVGGIALQSFFIAWLLFRLGFMPEWGYIATIIVSIACLIARLFLLRGMIQLSIKEFVRDVLIRVVVVSAISLVVPYFITFLNIEGWYRFLLVLITSIVWSSIIILIVGIDKNERVAILNTAKKRIWK